MATAGVELLVAGRWYSAPAQGPYTIQAWGKEVRFLISPTEPASPLYMHVLGAWEFWDENCASTDQIWLMSPFAGGRAIVTPIVAGSASPGAGDGAAFIFDFDMSVGLAPSLWL